MTPTISLIITTYNWPEALELVLRSAFEQSHPCHEIIVADDGSRDETKALVDRMQSQSPVPLHHVWQPDEGFQAAKIRNKAAAKATGTYLVYIDGDCLLRPNFIAAHVQLARPARFVAGNRVLCTEAFTTEVLAEQKPIFRLSPLKFFSLPINRPLSLLALPLGPLRYLQPSRWRGAKTCNLALWRDDLIKINGFDESFVGWGFEDSDLVIRLLNSGIVRTNGKFATTVIHLWHGENSRTQEAENLNKLQATIDQGTQQAQLGIAQYL